MQLSVFISESKSINDFSSPLSLPITFSVELFMYVFRVDFLHIPSKDEECLSFLSYLANQWLIRDHSTGITALNEWMNVFISVTNSLFYPINVYSPQPKKDWAEV